MALFELAAWALFDEAAGFDAKDAGELDVGGVALAGEELGAIHAGGFDADEDAAGGGGRDGDVLDLEDFGAAGGVHDGCAHCFGHCGDRGSGGEEVVVGRCCLLVWGKEKGSVSIEGASG